MRTILPLFLALTLAACAGTKQSQRPREEPTFAEQIVKYEASFRPSDYDPDATRQSRDTMAQRAATDSVAPDTLASTEELTQGFRVQLFSSMSIDEAKAKKTDVEEAFPGEWFYLEYDPPAYKVRAGNFLSRYEAEKFVKQLEEKGFPGAWTVPARVFRNPPEPSSPH